MQEIDDIIAADETGEIPEEEEDISSWTIEDGVAIKQTDRHVFLYRETIVPPEVLEYFGAGGLVPGRKRTIVLWYGDRRFDARIEKTVHAAPRTRMLWKADFGAVLAQQYPGWLDYFTRHREESGDTPPLRFTPRAEPGNFDVELEGAAPAAEETVRGRNGYRQRHAPRDLPVQPARAHAPFAEDRGPGPHLGPHEVRKRGQVDREGLPFHWHGRDRGAEPCVPAEPDP
jgi:hypothetical protein